MVDGEGMVTVTIRYFGKVADIVGKKSEIVGFDGSTVRDLIAFLCGKYGERMMRVLVDSDDSLREDVIILVDQKPIGGDVDTPLFDRSVVSILPFVSGG